METTRPTNAHAAVVAGGDHTVQQLLTSVNEVENRVRIVGSLLSEAGTRRDVLHNDDKCLQSEVRHLSMRETDLKRRLANAVDHVQRLDGLVANTEQSIQHARRETDVVVTHFEAARRRTEEEASAWSQRAAALSMRFDDVGSKLRKAENGDLAALAGLDGTLTTLRAQIEQLETLQIRSAHATPVTNSTSPMMNNNNNNAVVVVSLSHVIEQISQLQRQDAERSSQHARHVTALGREVDGLRKQHDDVAAWSQQVCAAHEQMQATSSVLDDVVASGHCPQCRAGVVTNSPH
eukprot:PhM_4_TR10010/c2_g1_i1/m.34929